MSATATETESHDDLHPGETHPHAPDSFYFKVAGVLAVITAVEVGASYAGFSSTLLILSLFPMMIAKFAVVAALFMHLKGDNRLFTRFFVTGIVLASIVYAIVLFTFQTFG